MISRCKNCETEFKHNPSQGGKYCCRRCQHEHRYNKNLKDWLDHRISGRMLDDRPSGFVRKYLLEQCNYSCTECGWGEANPVNGIIHLEIDHIDGDRKNGYRENLQVLCPNCHSLTKTYKTLNKNIGYHKQGRLFENTE